MAKMDRDSSAGAGGTGNGHLRSSHRAARGVLAHSSRRGHPTLDEYSLRRTFISGAAARPLSGFGNSPATTRPAAIEANCTGAKSLSRRSDLSLKRRYHSRACSPDARCSASRTREVAVNITDQLLGALSQYGLPVLFAVIMIAAVGIPLPISMMLVAAGSFVELGEMKLWQVIVVASAGAVIGDQIGYALGRWGGHRVIARIRRRGNGTAKIEQAQAFAKRWGATGIFLTRWLITPLGPWLNLTSGMAAYPWTRFFLWDVLGEVLWVVLYVMIGKFFSDRVQALVEILGNLAWVIVGLIAALILGWKLLRYLQPAEPLKGAKIVAER